MALLMASIRWPPVPLMLRLTVHTECTHPAQGVARTEEMTQPGLINLRLLVSLVPDLCRRRDCPGVAADGGAWPFFGTDQLLLCTTR